MREQTKDFEKRALHALYNLSRATMRAKTVEDVFEKMLATAMNVIGVEKASIMRYDRRERVLKIVAAKGIPKKIIDSVRVAPGRGISGKVFKSERPLLIKDVRKRKEALKKKRYKSSSLISAPVTCLPLKVRGRAVGVINMTDKRDGRPFTKSDLHLLTTIAAEAASYVRIFDLAEELKESEKLRREVEIAREIQRSLLPQKIPQLSGITAAGRCLMADRIGGDYYDVLASGWAPPSFVVADVSGHDIGAALLMSAFRSALRAEMGVPILPPSAVARRMNKVLYNDLVRADQFISMFYLQYIHSTRTIRYSSAGHHPAILCGRKGIKLLETEGPLLGIERGEHFFEAKLTVEKGDVVVMYTDGLVEAANIHGRRFGMAGLKKSILKNFGKSPHKIVDLVLTDLKNFMGGAPIKDDITLLVIKFM